MGMNIQVFQNVKDIPETNKQEGVIQRYINNPLLLDGLKFEIRVFVIVIGGTLSKNDSELKNEGTINAYLCDEGIANFCT